MEDRDTILDAAFRQYHNSLKRYCYRLIKYDRKYFSTVDDCVQEAFYRATLHFDLFIASPNPYGWLAVCCQNYYRDFFRKKQRRSRIVGVSVALSACAEISDPHDILARWYARREAQDTIDELFRQLTPLEKQVFHDYFEDKMSMQAVAVKRGTTFNCVRGAVERIRKKLLAGEKMISLLFICQCILGLSRLI